MSELSVTDVAMQDVFWARPLPGPVMFLVFLAVVGFCIYLYRRTWGLQSWLRSLLGVGRCIALAMVVAALFEPTVRVRGRR